MDLFSIPSELTGLSAAELDAFITATRARLAEVSADPRRFVNEERSIEELRSEVETAVASVKEALELYAAYEAEGDGGAGDGDAAAEGDGDAADGGDGDGDGDGDGEDGEEAAAGDGDDDEETEGDGAETAEGDDESAAELSASIDAGLEATRKSVTAAGSPAPKRQARPRRAPVRARAAEPQAAERQMVALTAAAGSEGLPFGTEFPSAEAIAEAMIRRHRNFTGIVPEGASEKFAIARASWSHLYPEDRVVAGKDEATQKSLIDAVVNEAGIRAEFAKRKALGVDGALTASGGLCAPVTPYYNLQMVSVAERPVRAALPAFNADRGGIRAARPATLAAITTGVGQMTAAQDAAGGTTGTKTCQSVDCPDFVETDVEILFHCLRFGNLGARTFPERVAQWNNLVLAAHARLAERLLLTQIDTLSTAVSAASLGLGASADLLSQILVAAAGMRSRHRMDPEAVLRVILPYWVLDLLVSDVYRSQFQRFDMSADKFVALLRQGNVEPSFAIDGASGQSQEFGTQSAGALLPFPPTVQWYLFPEGSFLYVDGGVLELGLVRDSVLNATNDFEIFGESFENVAFIGVESLAVTSTVCDSGITGGTHNVLCPIDYTHTS